MTKSLGRFELDVDVREDLMGGGLIVVGFADFSKDFRAMLIFLAIELSIMGLLAKRLAMSSILPDMLCGNKAVV